MKRVLRPDDDRDRRLQFVKQLHEFFVVPENYGVCLILFCSLVTCIVVIISTDLFLCISVII